MIPEAIQNLIIDYERGDGWAKQELSEVQKRAFGKLYNAGVWMDTRALGESSLILGSLVKCGLVSRRSGPGALFEPRGMIVYKARYRRKAG